MDSPTTHPTRCNPRFVIPVLLGLLFGLASLFHSLHQGQLSVPTTYDDIYYFVDAAQRLQSVYDHGPARFFRDYVSQPPYSPLATLVPMLAFSLFGLHDWAPAALNILYAIAILIMLRVAMAESAWTAYLGVAIPLVAWPIMGQLVIQSRPDIVVGLLTAFGVFHMLSRRWLLSDTRNLIIVSSAFGLALLAKPSISPITLSLYVSSLTVATLIDLRSPEPRPSLTQALFFNAKSLLVAALIAFPHYALIWREMYEHIYVTTFGTEKDIWSVKSNVPGHLLYYVTGPGASLMMGYWLAVTAAALFISLSLAYANRIRIEPIRLGGLFLVCTLGYLGVSIPAHKSVFLGVVVSSFVLMAFVRSMIFNLRILSGSRWRGWHAAYISAAMLTALLLYQWPWQGEPERWTTSLQRRDLVSKLALQIGAQPIEHATVFFVGLAKDLNPHALRFELLRHRVRGVTVTDRHRSNDMSDYKVLIDVSDFVVTFTNDNDEVESWLPSAQVIPAVNASLSTSSSFVRLSTFRSPSGHGDIELYMRRLPFSDIYAEEGLERLEGPYPQVHLPRVRWGLGPAMSFRVKRPADGHGLLRLTAQSFIRDQSMDVVVNGREMTRCAFSMTTGVKMCDVRLRQSHGESNVVVRFRKWEDTRRHAVLFHEIAIVRGSGK
jgi:hypothetical protein